METQAAFTLKYEEHRTCIVHASGNSIRVESRGVERALLKAAAALEPQDMQCLLAMAFEAHGGLLPMTVHAGQAA